MARAIIVGCGCRGRELGRALAQDGHLVRGTSRSAHGIAAINAAGLDALQADPDRLGTVVAALDGVSVLVWLMASAVGPAEAVAALHGPRLQSMLEAVVDTPVRGVVYEAAGSADRELLAGGSALARRAGETFHMPVELIEQDPADVAGWVARARAAVAAVLKA